MNLPLKIIFLKFCLLTHFMPLVSFYAPWKHQKTSGKNLTLASNILCKITFWNKQNLLNKELIIWSGLRR